MNTRKIDRAVETTKCSKHKAVEGIACWTIIGSEDGRFHQAICGQRIRRAGFVGKIKPESMRTAAPQKRNSKNK